ncbi:hypothetical protein P8625_11245 [Tenacibaculum tangerinum]|uniref:DUF6973 domain-containing protein n=1 Tax=Tenacibaculum tangerinum TaxID=3038772 RepID=A0ABY8L441_9FLAO|nr:hypothetical protein [Tenacibaculum tangerinum]WGH74660.1 hypothetical protein P8625_11245 [Tenacibaculum tangerinum]
MLQKLLLGVLILPACLNAQSNWQAFKKLQGAQKTWVLLHPFKAKKAYALSLEVSRISDSLKVSPLLDGDAAGGKVDAFRHAFWMALLQQEIGEKAARSLGKAHEKDNYKTYKEQKREDGVVPDQISSKMDLFNNEVGLSLSKEGGNLPKNGLIYRVINALHQGKLKVIKKDTLGRFLTCSGKLIPEKTLIGTWENDKCLVDSNYNP